MRTGLLTGVLLAGTALTTTVAEASHFRGAAMVPTVNASGLLTVTTTSFWRPTAVSSVSPFVAGGSFMTQQSSATDTSDVRFTRVTQVHTIQLQGPGLFQIQSSSCCRVGGIINAAESDWTMNSAISWNGSTANAPILFNFSAIQPEVVRGANYSDNLGATSGSGQTLTYNQNLNQNINSQPPGFTINPTTGQLTIPAASTATYLDNPTGNVGADYAFSGNIIASDGSSVEFDWLFDAVNTAGNLAPDVDDVVINALVGSTINHTVTGSDPNGDPLTWSLDSFSALCGAAPSFDPSTQGFSWNSTGCAPGTYIAQIRASDGSLTDVGSVTINLATNGQTTVFEPATLLTFGAGLVGLGVMSRRRRQKA